MLQSVRKDGGRAARWIRSGIAAFVAGVVALGALAVRAVAAETASVDGSRLSIERTVEWTYPDGEQWTWTIEGTGTLDNGVVAGSVTLTGRVMSPGGGCDEYGLGALGTSFAVTGTYAANPDNPGAIDFSFQAPVRIVRTCVKGRPRPAEDDGGWWLGLSDTLDFSDAEPVSSYLGTLEEGQYSDRQTVGEDPGVLVSTEITLVGAGGGDLVVTAEHGLIPGHSALINAIDVQVPERVLPAGAGAATLRISIGQAGYGGLSETPEAARAGRGQRTLEIGGIEPGSTHRVYYGWRGALIPDFTETVTAQIIGRDIDGTASFRVGFGVALTGFGRFSTVEPKNREVVPFRIVAEATGQGDAVSLPHLAQTFDLEMVLGLERIGFQPVNSVEGLLSSLSFNLTDWVEALANQGASLDAEATGDSPGSLYGDRLYWRVGEDGRLLDPGETEPGTRFPNYLPRQRGVHLFRARVTGIAHDIEVLDNPDPKAAGHTLHVDLKDNAQAFMDDVVLGCMEEILGSVTDEVLDAAQGDIAELAKLELGAVDVLWACLHNALETQLVEEWLADHIYLNTLVMTFLDSEEDAAELTDLAQSLVGEAAQSTRARAVILVDGVSGAINAVSSEDGPLRAAPSPLLATPGDGVTRGGSGEQTGNAERLLSRKDRQGLYVRKGEAIRLSLPADAQADVVLVTPDQSRILRPASPHGDEDRVYLIPAE